MLFPVGRMTQEQIDVLFRLLLDEAWAVHTDDD